MSSIFKYLRYSGAAVIVSINPLYWKAWPWYRNESSAEVWTTNTYAVGFLFLTIRIWIDDGNW
jgi:hypothetical protein